MKIRKYEMVCIVHRLNIKLLYANHPPTRNVSVIYRDAAAEIVIIAPEDFLFIDKHVIHNLPA